MIKSMTGFASLTRDDETATITVTVKSVNHRYLDLQLRVPPSLGGVESLIEHPGRMTHQSTAGSPLQVPETLVRLSVGIEHVDDLLEDLRQALS